MAGPVLRVALGVKQSCNSIFRKAEAMSERTDSERLDWLNRTYLKGCLGIAPYKDGYGKKCITSLADITRFHDDIRSAIDAIMDHEENSDGDSEQ